jgi:hypothetical protein
MAWVRPRRSSPNRPRPRRSGPGQEGDVEGNSGGGGGSSLPAGGSAAPGSGSTGLAGRRGARAPRDQCHQPAQDVAGPFCRRGFRPLLLAPPGRVATWCSLESPSLINASSVRRKSSWLPSVPARTMSISRSARAMAGIRHGWRARAEMRRGKWLHRKGRGNGPGIKVDQAALTSMRSSGIHRSESSFGV